MKSLAILLLLVLVLAAKAGNPILSFSASTNQINDGFDDTYPLTAYGFANSKWPGLTGASIVAAVNGGQTAAALTTVVTNVVGIVTNTGYTASGAVDPNINGDYSSSAANTFTNLLLKVILIESSIGGSNYEWSFKDLKYDSIQSNPYFGTDYGQTPPNAANWLGQVSVGTFTNYTTNYTYTTNIIGTLPGSQVSGAVPMASNSPSGYQLLDTNSTLSASQLPSIPASLTTNFTLTVNGILATGNVATSTSAGVVTGAQSNLIATALQSVPTNETVFFASDNYAGVSLSSTALLMVDPVRGVFPNYVACGVYLIPATKTITHLGLVWSSSPAMGATTNLYCVFLTNGVAAYVSPPLAGSAYMNTFPPNSTNLTLNLVIPAGTLFSMGFSNNVPATVNNNFVGWTIYAK